MSKQDKTTPSDAERTSRQRELDSLCEQAYAYAKEYKLNLLVMRDNPKDEKKALIARASTTKFAATAIRCMMTEEPAALEIVRSENPELFCQGHNKEGINLPPGLTDALKKIGIPADAIAKGSLLNIGGGIGAMQFPLEGGSTDRIKLATAALKLASEALKLAK